MNQSFFAAAVGAQQQQQRMNVQGNNIANVNTYGFKAEKPSFSALMYNRITGIEDAQLPRGTGARIAMADTDFSGAPVAESDIAHSYAILGSGFFGVVDPGTGEISYTRDGSFTLSEFTQADEEGNPETVYYLSDGMGRFVLNRQGAPIQVTDAEADQPVGVFDFVNTDGMLHLSENRFQPIDKNGQVRISGSAVQRGMLEMSNADLSYEMVKVIEAQRSYSYALRMVTVSDEVESTINGLRG